MHSIWLRPSPEPEHDTALEYAPLGKRAEASVAHGEIDQLFLGSAVHRGGQLVQVEELLGADVGGQDGVETRGLWDDTEFDDDYPYLTVVAYGIALTLVTCLARLVIGWLLPQSRVGFRPVDEIQTDDVEPHAEMVKLEEQWARPTGIIASTDTDAASASGSPYRFVEDGRSTMVRQSLVHDHDELMA